MDLSPVQQYLATMKQVCPELQDEHLEEFCDSLKVWNFNKKALIFDYQALHQHVLFVNKGLARAYYINQDGNEHTAWFCQEGEFITDYPAFLAQTPSYYLFEALEATTVVALPKSAMERGYQQFSLLQKYGRLIAEGILSLQQTRIESFLFKTAKERYLELLENEVDLVNRISQGLLASYIGIERQSLTRIRKQISENK